jgi:hypothetical protein
MGKVASSTKLFGHNFSINSSFSSGYRSFQLTQEQFKSFGEEEQSGHHKEAGAQPELVGMLQIQTRLAD